MTDHQPVILNNPVPLDIQENEPVKEVSIKEDYTKELIQDLKAHMHQENLDIILPDQLEIKEKKKSK